MYILRSNYSNNSVALIQWAKAAGLKDVTVVYIDTGWAAAGWLEHVAHCEAHVQTLGFRVEHIKPSSGFADIMEMKGGFPSRQNQWCALHLKGIPFLKWIEEIDPDSQATVLLPKCPVDTDFTEIPEFIDSCEYNGERKVWHPLFQHSRAQRDQLLDASPFDSLPHRSLECSPCINSTVLELRHLKPGDMEKTLELEEDVEMPLFSPQDCGGAEGIEATLAWAKDANEDALNYQFGCSAFFGCGS